MIHINYTLDLKEFAMIIFFVIFTDTTDMRFIHTVALEDVGLPECEAKEGYRL